MRKKQVIVSFFTLSLIFNINLFADVKKLDDVTVSVQKQDENLKDIPFFLNHFSKFDIEDKDIERTSDIAKYTPNFAMMDNGTRGNSTPSIRGIHAEVQTLQLSTGLYIDGIPSLSPIGFDAFFDDVESIQVLKGPQTTLYGKNAEVGAIIVNTSKPNNDSEAKIDVLIGNNKKRKIKGQVGGPIIKDKVYLKLTALQEQEDGFMKQKSTNQIIDDTKHNYYKLNFRVTPNDNFDISFINTYLRYDDKASRINSIMAKDSRVADINLIGYLKSKQRTSSLKLKYNFSENTSLESISALNIYDVNSVYDGDVSPYDFFHTHRKDKIKGFLQEFKFISKFNKFKYIVGIDMNRLKTDLDTNILKYANPQYNIYLNDIHSIDEGKDISYGAFFHSTYEITDNLSLITGVRYDREKKEIHSLPVEVLRPRDFNEPRTYKEISPKIALNYQLNENYNIYGSASKGYRPGGFNVYAPKNSFKTYNEEKIFSYEIGNKFIYKNFYLDASIYYMDVDDMQVQEAINPQTILITNAAKAKSKGVELNMNYNITDEFQIFSSIGFNDTKFDSFKDSNGDYSNNINPNAPKYNFNAGFEHRAENGFYLRLDINGQGKVFADKQNLYSRKAFRTVDTKVGFEKDEFDIYLYSKNLFDKRYDFVGYHGGKYTIPSTPREIGLQARYRF